MLSEQINSLTSTTVTIHESHLTNFFIILCIQTPSTAIQRKEYFC